MTHMKNKLLTAQDIFKNVSGTFANGFNSAVYGEQIGCTASAAIEFFQGWSKAMDMISDGEIYYTHNFHKKECERNGNAFLYGGFWVCNECGKRDIDKPYWTIKVFKDGNEFCCVGENFINLQESNNYAFGKTKQEAINNYGTKFLTIKDSHEHTNTNVTGTTI